MRTDLSKSDRRQLFICGIVLVLIAAGFLTVCIMNVIRTAQNAKYYNTALSGTVIASTVRHETDENGSRKTLSDVTIRYDGLNGTEHTIRRRGLAGSYQEGRSIALKCTEDRKEAVLSRETHQDPGYIIIMAYIGLIFGLAGVLLITGKGLQSY